MKLTKNLIAGGIVAGPLFAGLLLVQAFTREGFNSVIHAPSQLGTGDLGWIQSINFLVAGVLFLALAFGLRQIMKGKPSGVLAPLTVGIFALTLILSGLFPTDPAFGFPLGAETPKELSTSGKIHMIAPITGGLILPVAFFAFARFFAKEMKTKGWMIISLIIGIAYFLAGATFMATKNEAGMLNLTFLWIAGTIGWASLSLVAWKVKSELLPKSTD